MRDKLLIYFTAFFCGMCVMAVELSASRFLAPIFGTSSIIWTIIIGIIMISMSIGNIIGGRSADKYNDIGRLYSLLWIAVLWIAAIPLIGKYIVDFIAAALALLLSQNLLAAGSTMACLIIFSAPLVILGMVSPYLVKVGVKDIKNSGKITGEIYAVNTIGDIIGTFIPTFLTIPTVGTSKTFYIFALILNLICIYYFMSMKKKYIPKIISAAVITVLIFAPLKDTYAFWKNNIVYEGESTYNYLQVSQDKDSVILSTNVAFGVQSIYKKNKELSGMYYDYALMAPMFIKDMNSSKKMDDLILGFGTGTFAKQCKYYYPATRTDGVEIDEKIAELSKKYFDVKDNEASIYINDGRTFLYSRDAKKYDLIMIDAYRDVTIPFHMSTIEFFREVKKHLNPGGVIVININMRSKNHTEINDYLCETVKRAMNKVYTYNLEESYNTIVFASDDKNCKENFLNNIGKMPDNAPLRSIAEEVSENLKEIKNSDHIFTDEIAPVEVLGEKVLDDIVNNEVKSFKQDLKSNNQGLKGLMDYLK